MTSSWHEIASHGIGKATPREVLRQPKAMHDPDGAEKPSKIQAAGRQPQLENPTVSWRQSRLLHTVFLKTWALRRSDPTSTAIDDRTPGHPHLPMHRAKDTSKALIGSVICATTGRLVSSALSSAAPSAGGAHTLEPW